jgi:hypothetical protein
MKESSAAYNGARGHIADWYVLANGYAKELESTNASKDFDAIRSVPISKMRYVKNAAQPEKEFVCRHFAECFTTYASRKTDLGTHSLGLETPRERHAINVARIRFPEDGFDIYAFVEPQDNGIIGYYPARGAASQPPDGTYKILTSYYRGHAQVMGSLGAIDHGAFPVDAWLKIPELVETFEKRTGERVGDLFDDTRTGSALGRAITSPSP